MEQTKHTPGPWLVGQTITAPHPDRFPGSHERITVAQRVNRPADARLIAAAPDMLDALQSLVDMAATFSTELHKDHPDVLAARAAIAKARGQ